MTGELMFFASVALAGSGATAAAPVPRAVRAAVALLAGLAAFCLVTVAAVLIGIPTSLLRMSLVLLAAVSVFVAVSFRRRNDLREHLTGLAIDAGLVATFCALVTVATRTLEPGRSTYDSYDYAKIAGLLANGRGSLVDYELLRTRLLGYPSLNLAAFTDGRVHLTAGMVVAGIALLVILAFVTASLLKPELGAARSWVIALLGAGTLLTAYHFVFELFYVNSHLTVGAFVLLALVPAMFASAMPVAVGGLVPAAALCTAAIPLLRPEGGLLAMILVVATLRARHQAPTLRVVAVAAAATTIAWNLHLIRVAVGSNQTGSEILQPAATVVAAVALVAVAEWTWRRPRMVPLVERLVELGAWSAFVLLAIVDPETVGESAGAFFRNVFRGAGTWGPTMPIVLVAFVVVQVVVRWDEVRASAYTVRVFFPLMFALAPIRDAAYRVGPGDSLNRALTHVLPTMLVVVLVASIRGDVRFSRPTLRPKDAAVQCAN